MLLVQSYFSDHQATTSVGSHCFVIGDLERFSPTQIERMEQNQLGFITIFSNAIEYKN